MNILIVDDDMEIVDLLESSVSLWGYSAAKANNGMQALKMLQQSPYDVVITDAQMPGMTGFELCKQICFRYPHMYIIGITGCLGCKSSRKPVQTSISENPFPWRNSRPHWNIFHLRFPPGTERSKRGG